MRRFICYLFLLGIHSEGSSQKYSLQMSLILIFWFLVLTDYWYLIHLNFAYSDYLIFLFRLNHLHDFLRFPLLIFALLSMSNGSFTMWKPESVAAWFEVSSLILFVQSFRHSLNTSTLRLNCCLFLIVAISDFANSISWFTWVYWLWILAYALSATSLNLCQRLKGRGWPA